MPRRPTPRACAILAPAYTSPAFRNIRSFNATHQRPNVVKGIDGDHKVRNISFQNVFTDDKCISDAKNGSFEIDPMSTNAVRIMKSSDGSGNTP